MSQATKRKHVTQEVLSSYKLPENNERIVKVKSTVNFYVIRIIYTLIDFLDRFWAVGETTCMKYLIPKSLK